jgi:hypothetical protein
MSILLHHFKELTECIKEVEWIVTRLNSKNKERLTKEKEDKEKEQLSQQPRPATALPPPQRPPPSPQTPQLVL